MARNLKRLAHLPSIRRLPLYLAELERLRVRGEAWASTTRLAAERDVDPTQVRKDLALTGVVGQRKLGYRVEEAIAAIEEFLGWHRDREAFLVGAGHLGTALLGFQPRYKPGIRIVAAYDRDPAKHGAELHGRPVKPLDELVDDARRLGIRVGVITTPDAAAQGVADRLVAGGVLAIWNFSSVALNVPDGVCVEDAGLRASLAMLGNRLQEREAALAADATEEVPR
jgi:redox-sensing transcriptional repressor